MSLSLGVPNGRGFLADDEQEKANKKAKSQSRFGPGTKRVIPGPRPPESKGPMGPPAPFSKEGDAGFVGPPRSLQGEPQPGDPNFTGPPRPPSTSDFTDAEGNTITRHGPRAFPSPEARSRFFEREKSGLLNEFRTQERQRQYAAEERSAQDSQARTNRRLETSPLRRRDELINELIEDANAGGGSKIKSVRDRRRSSQQALDSLGGNSELGDFLRTEEIAGAQRESGQSRVEAARIKALSEQPTQADRIREMLELEKLGADIQNVRAGTQGTIADTGRTVAETASERTDRALEINNNTLSVLQNAGLEGEAIAEYATFVNTEVPELNALLRREIGDDAPQFDTKLNQNQDQVLQLVDLFNMAKRMNSEEDMWSDPATFRRLVAAAGSVN